MNSIVGRLAPSPTGGQHLGNARTYLIAWLSVRSQGGKMILRIEDIDSPRVKESATDQLLEDLQWLGLDWDIGPEVQSTRLAVYEEVLEKLKMQGKVYPCVCTRKDIEQAASAPHLEHEMPPYPGLCAERTVAEAKLISKPFAWRYRAERISPSFDDFFVGHIPSRPEYGGDFVVWKNNNTPAYQLAVVVDDAAMGITEVVRADDLIPSTPRQLQLYQSLALEPPRFAHVPLVVGKDGRRLAKRHGDTRLSSYRSAGISSEYIVGYLAWSCGWLETPREISAKELISKFDWKSIPHQPWVADDIYLKT